ncbi:MAG: hemolysin III family protein [Clostridia bacterium]|nr:hemolysin III family protein [Clostridia bacterium]
MNAKQINKEYKLYKNVLRKKYDEELSMAKSMRDSALENYYNSGEHQAKINPPKRPLLEEIGNSITHGVGAIFSFIAFALMFLASDTIQDKASSIIYFCGLLLMFIMSCLYHAFPYGSAVKRLFRRFDYCGIYLLIGATYAPILLSFIGGVYGTTFLIAQWLIIITGITFIAIFGPTRLKPLHMTLYVAIGWSALSFIPTMISQSPNLFAYILVGGIAYTLGIIPFALKKGPSHFIWHFFVLIGAIVQWLGIYQFIFLA